MESYSMQNNRRKKVEILAPAGSYDIMTAVINAGADAVYLGGDLFGARAFAGNFNQDELLKAIDFAHLHGRKIYLTVNTLLKEKELKDDLISYLTPFYEAGLDAVIVQDFGVLKMIREHFPDLHIHASTQMAITGHFGAQMLKDAGATRIVTARELSGQEIKSIHDQCDIEIESFVHGALCYCYSGQCLFSSMNGGRSGNRGRCAQPCRMNYIVSEEDGDSRLNTKDQEYVLSPKDMCALPILPDVIDAGVYSLKIEGRMKNVTYAAGVTSLYRKYVDLYLKKGRKGYHVSEQDMKDLMDIYNRGNFTSGYYQKSKGKDMISLSRPNHMGTKALEILSNKNGLVTFRSLEHIYPQDVFEIDREKSFSSGNEYQLGETFQVNLPKRYRLYPGKIIYRTRNNEIVTNVHEKYVETKCKEKVTAFVSVVVGKPLTVTLMHKECCVTVKGNLVEAAQKQPVTKEKIKQQFSKLGDTEFEMDVITVELSGEAFIPVGHMNELRREAVEKLTDVITRQFKRSVSGQNLLKIPTSESVTSGDALNIKKTDTDSTEYVLTKNILVTTFAQVKCAVKLDEVHAIYLHYGLLTRDENKFKTFVHEIKCAGKLAVLALPHMLRDKNNQRFYLLLEKAFSTGVFTFLVRTMEELGALSEWKKKHEIDRVSIIFDACMYVWNSKAKEQLKFMADSHGLTLLWVTLPLEETAKEMADTIQMQPENDDAIKKELIVYTRIPLMISEQCVRKTFEKCDGKNGRIIITDRKSKDYLVKSYCDYCYTVIYDQKWMNLTQLKEEIAISGADYLRFEFVDETDSSDQIQELLNGNIDMKDNTNGHFLLGVE